MTQHLRTVNLPSLAHTIVSWEFEGDRSAHIDGVESELIVHSGHSTQSTPAAIEEIRRIRLLHAASYPAREGPPTQERSP